MKLVSYLVDGNDQLAFLHNDRLYDCDLVNPALPNSMNMFLHFWEDMFPIAQATNAAIVDGRISGEKGLPIDDLNLLAPVPFPTSCRDGYAFKQHVAAARPDKNVPAEFDRFPVFYFTNHHCIQGPGEISCMPDHLVNLDFELEAAIVICKTGRNIKAEDAEEYIGGLMIMNDVSARGFQLEEMKLNLGPAKGKDFATILGPCLVTLDELEQYAINPPENHEGKAWNLSMKCRVNGEQVSIGNMGDMSWTFAELIERCSYGTTLFPGDVIGSGTVGTGCFLELNNTAKLNNPHYAEQWLKEGDIVELEIEGIGTLRNTIVKEEEDFSILNKKKI